MRLAYFLESTGESQKAFGARIGVTQSAVAQMLATRVSAEMVLKVCGTTEWQVTPFEERPDLYPHPEDGMPKVPPVASDGARVAA